MRLTDMKDEWPHMPESMKVQVRDLVENESGKADLQTGRGRRSRKKMIVLAAALAASFVAITVGANGLVRLKEKKAGSYGRATIVDTAGTKAPSVLQDVDISFDRLPDGYAYQKQGGQTFRNEVLKDGSDSNLAAAYAIYLDKDGSTDLITANVTSGRKLTVGDHEAVIYQRGASISQGAGTEAYVIYPEYWLAVQVQTRGDVSEEELSTLLNGLTVTPTGITMQYGDAVTLSQWTMKDASLASGQRTFRLAGTIGDTVSFTGSMQDGTDVPMEAAVTEVHAYDSLDVLGDSVPDEWKNDVGADGKLADNTLTYYIAGDGINTQDQLVKTETVKQKLVCATVEFTNASDEDAANVNFVTELRRILVNSDQTLEEKPEALASQDLGAYIKGFADKYGYDTIRSTGHGTEYEMGWFDVSQKDGSTDGSNYIPHMSAGETVPVHFAWIVDESDFPNLYLNVNSHVGEGDNLLIGIGSVLNTEG